MFARLRDHLVYVMCNFANSGSYRINPIRWPVYLACNGVGVVILVSVEGYYASCAGVGQFEVIGRGLGRFFYLSNVAERRGVRAKRDAWRNGVVRTVVNDPRDSMDCSSACSRCLCIILAVDRIGLCLFRATDRVGAYQTARGRFLSTVDRPN